MSVFFVLMGVSLFLGTAFISFFVWAVKSGQFDDTGTPPLRVLSEDDPGQAAKAAEKKKQEKR